MSEEGGVTPTDVMQDVTLLDVTHRGGKGALGT